LTSGRPRFQFLSRNSVRWDHQRTARPESIRRVSIPQSEFCPLGRQDPGSDPERIVGFNSSVGILSVGTEGAVDAQGRVKSFNSSVGILSVGTSVAGQIVVIVNEVSIPQSEFCPLGPDDHHLGHFNSPRFQFLSRNSVRWDRRMIFASSPRLEVSIPQSEFCPLGLKGVREKAMICVSFNSSVGILSVGTSWKKVAKHVKKEVSIPQSEFCPLGRSIAPASVRSHSRFQFLSRNSVRWDA